MNRKLARIATAAVAGLVACVAYAGDDATSLSYISYIERYATVKPASSTEALEAQINMPILSGDRLETARGARVEIQLADASTLWLDDFTTVDFDALAFSRDDPAERTALYLATGTAAVEIPDGAQGAATLRVETPAGVVFLHRPGLYRLDLDGDSLHVASRAGLAEVPDGMGSALVRAGQDRWVDGEGRGAALAQTAFTDDFWSWVEDRRHPQDSGQTARYIEGASGARAGILDNYGDWVYVDAFSSWMWRPRVSLTWVPYSYGRWYWTPVGWNWISYEPWGWYPFHYGSWYLDAGIGWVWCWDWVWGPAWVHWIYTPGYVGWCPRGYYDWWYYRNYDPPSQRWARTALDFSGRVRLRDVDPRPWTIVPAGSFGDGRIDRVRVEPIRVLRDTDGDGFVTSGPLITPSRDRQGPEQLLSDRLRSTTRAVPGLDSLLGRGTAGGSGPALGRSISVRPVETGQLIGSPVTGTVRRSVGAGGERTGAPGSPGDVRLQPRRQVPGAEPGSPGAVQRGGASEVRERGRYAPAPARVRPGTATPPAPRERAPQTTRTSPPSQPRSVQPAKPTSPQRAAPPSPKGPTQTKPSGQESGGGQAQAEAWRDVRPLRGGNLIAERLRAESVAVERGRYATSAPRRVVVESRRPEEVVRTVEGGTTTWQLSPRTYPAIEARPAEARRVSSPPVTRVESFRSGARTSAAPSRAAAPRASGAISGRSLQRAARPHR